MYVACTLMYIHVCYIYVYVYTWYVTFTCIYIHVCYIYVYVYTCMFHLLVFTCMLHLYVFINMYVVVVGEPPLLLAESALVALQNCISSFRKQQHKQKLYVTGGKIHRVL